MILKFLIQYHETLNHEIIVFCYSHLMLNYYAGYSVIVNDGDLNMNKFFGIYKNSTEIKTILLQELKIVIDIPMGLVSIEIENKKFKDYAAR